jgi:hypothetical protein
MASEAFELALRVAIVPIGELVDAGHPVLVARLRTSEHVALAMLAGSGPSLAERWIKDEATAGRYAVAEGPAEADFSGFECRWRPIPNRRGRVMSLLVRALDEDRVAAAATYAEVVEAIHGALAEDEGRPVAVETLALGSGGPTFDQEARIRSGRAKGLAYLWRRSAARVSTTVGRALFGARLRAFGFDGAHYRDEVAANTDFRKFDDTLRMVLDVSDEQRATIEGHLARAHAQGRIAYGIHLADAALMTCAIRSYDGDHVHFVDGADGGYALAAAQLKAQLAVWRGTANE